jgi:hypothetical protein
MLPWFWYVVWIVGPLLLSLRSRARARATVTTIAITGLVAAFAWHHLCPDNIGGSAVFMLLVLPGCCVPTAAVTATTLRGRRGELPAALLLGLVGFILGSVLAILLAVVTARGFDDAIVATVTQAIYSSCGAVLATLRKRT